MFIICSVHFRSWANFPAFPKITPAKIPAERSVTWRDIGGHCQLHNHTDKNPVNKSIIIGLIFIYQLKMTQISTEPPPRTVFKTDRVKNTKFLKRKPLGQVFSKCEWTLWMYLCHRRQNFCVWWYGLRIYLRMIEFTKVYLCCSSKVL